MIGVASVGAAVGGAQVAESLPEHVLRKLFAVLLIVVAARSPGGLGESSHNSGDGRPTKSSGSRWSTSRSARSSSRSVDENPEIGEARRVAAPHPRVPDVRLHPLRARCSASCSSTTTCPPTTAPRAGSTRCCEDPAHHAALDARGAGGRRGDRRRPEVRGRRAARPGRRRPRALPRVCPRAARQIDGSRHADSHNEVPVRRLLLIPALAAACSLVLVVGASTGSADRSAGATARAWAIKVIVPGQPSVGTRGARRPGRRGLLRRRLRRIRPTARSSAAGSVTTSVSATSGAQASAGATSQVTTLSLFKGEITADDRDRRDARDAPAPRARRATSA